MHLDDSRAEYPASTVKLPIYLTLAHRIQTGEVSVTWETPITVQPGDIVGGTGVLQNAPGSTHTVRDIARLMIVESDNVAANLLLGRLGGGQDTQPGASPGGRGSRHGYLGTLGVRSMTLRHGLHDTEAFATGMLSTTTSAALAQTAPITERDTATLDGAADVLALLGERGTHNPWHPADTVACGLAVAADRRHLPGLRGPPRRPPRRADRHDAGQSAPLHPRRHRADHAGPRINGRDTNRPLRGRSPVPTHRPLGTVRGHHDATSRAVRCAMPRGYVTGQGTYTMRKPYMEVATMTAVLETELCTYADHREELLRTAEDKFVLIHGHDVADVYAEKMEAVADGYRRFGNVPFLVKRIVRVEQPETFASNLLGI